MLLEQQQLMQTAALVSQTWHEAANQAMQRVVLNLSSAERQTQLPFMFTWLQEHGQQLKQLQLSASAPLGRAARKALLRCLVSERCQHSNALPTSISPVSINSITSITNNSSWDTTLWGNSNSRSDSDSGSSSSMQDGCVDSTPSTDHTKLQLQQLVLQLDLDVMDLLFLAHVVQHAPQLTTLKLQPLKPSLADLQLLVLACIVGNLVAADASGVFGRASVHALVPWEGDCKLSEVVMEYGGRVVGCDVHQWLSGGVTLVGCLAAVVSVRGWVM
jgi:hypothetical protein